MGAHFEALCKGVLMAASDFSCNFFRILTSGFEQCDLNKAPVSLYTQAVNIFPTRCHGKNGHFWIYLMNLQSLLSKLVYIQKSFSHNQVYGIGEFWTKFQDLAGLVALALRLFTFAFK